MGASSVQDQTLKAALKSGHRLELSLFEAGANVDVVEKQSSKSVYKLLRYSLHACPALVLEVALLLSMYGTTQS